MFTTDTQVIYENVLAGQTYSLPFDWLDNSQIVVYGNSELLSENSHYTLDISAKTITPLSNYEELSITRETIGSNLAYNFESTKSLGAAELQRALDIIRQLAEESGSGGLTLGIDGNYDARGKRITNVANPTLDTDVAIKKNVDAVKDLADFYYNLMKQHITLEQPYVDAGILDDIFIDNVYDCFTAFTTTYERVFDGGTALDISFASEINGGVAYNG